MERDKEREREERIVVVWLKKETPSALPAVRERERERERDRKRLHTSTLGCQTVCGVAKSKYERSKKKLRTFKQRNHVQRLLNVNSPRHLILGSTERLE